MKAALTFKWVIETNGIDYTTGGIKDESYEALDPLNSLKFKLTPLFKKWMAPLINSPKEKRSIEVLSLILQEGASCHPVHSPYYVQYFTFIFPKLFACEKNAFISPPLSDHVLQRMPLRFLMAYFVYYHFVVCCQDTEAFESARYGMLRKLYQVEDNKGLRSNTAEPWDIGRFLDVLLHKREWPLGYLKETFSPLEEILRSGGIEEEIKEEIEEKAPSVPNASPKSPRFSFFGQDGDPIPPSNNSCSKDGVFPPFTFGDIFKKFW